MPYETLHTETLYHGRAFNVRRDEIRLPDGKTARLEIVDHVGAVTLVPVDDQNRLRSCSRHFIKAGNRSQRTQSYQYCRGSYHCPPACDIISAL